MKYDEYYLIYLVVLITAPLTLEVNSTSKKELHDRSVRQMINSKKVKKKKK